MKPSFKCQQEKIILCLNSKIGFMLWTWLGGIKYCAVEAGFHHQYIVRASERERHLGVGCD